MAEHCECLSDIFSLVQIIRDKCVLLQWVIQNVIRPYTNMITVQFSFIKDNLSAQEAGRSRPLPLPSLLSLIGGVICSR